MNGHLGQCPAHPSNTGGACRCGSASQRSEADARGKARHTPGPWEYNGNATGCVRSDSSLMESQIVASVFGDRDDCRPDDTMRANAHLIAAVPDLFDALSALCNYIATGTDPEGDDCDKWVSRARAAIAKATGGQS